MKLKYDYGVMTGICTERVYKKYGEHMLTINVDYYGNFICEVKSGILNTIMRCLRRDFKHLNGNVYELSCYDVRIPNGQATVVQVNMPETPKNMIITETQWKYYNISNGRLEFHCEPEVFWVKLYQGKRLIRKYEMAGTSNIINSKFIM